MSSTFLRYLATAALVLPLLAERPAHAHIGAAATKAVIAQATVVLNVTGMT